MTEQEFQSFVVKHLTELSSEVKDLRQSQARMENELTDKVRALFDAREVQNDVNARIISALNRIDNKLDNQSWEVKLTAIK